MAGDSIAKGLSVWTVEFSSAVLIILVNKALMSGALAFKFPVTLTAAHFAWTAAGSSMLHACTKKQEEAGKDSEPPPLPPWYAIAGFVVLSSAAIILSNASLLLNSVAFYQIMKLATLPFVALVELVAGTKKLTWRHAVFYAVILAGVGLTIVGDVVASALGSVVAAVSFMSAGLHQFYCGRLQAVYSLTPAKLLAVVSPFKAGMLFILGPILDNLWFGGWIADYAWSTKAAVLILLTCLLAVALNISQYACISLLGPSLYSALSQGKTAAVVVLGSIYFLGSVDLRQVTGTAIAMAGVAALTHYEHSLRTTAAAAAAAPALPVQSDGEGKAEARLRVSSKGGAGTDSPDGNADVAIVVAEEEGKPLLSK